MMNLPLKILVVEDETKVASFIKQGLAENGFDVDLANSAEKGLSMIIGGLYHVVILDLVLPGMSGFEMCRMIRNRNNQVKILMLSALGNLRDKLKGFELGADDYLVKPFDFPELLARIKAVTKWLNVPNKVNHLLASGDLVMNLNTKCVHRNQQKIELTSKEFALLEYLLRNKGKVVSRAEIASQVWDIHFDTKTNVIDVYINFLRKKIDHGSERKLIQTLVGSGYLLKDFDGALPFNQ